MLLPKRWQNTRKYGKKIGRDEQAMIQAADDAELQDQMIRATDEAEDKYLEEEAVKALGKLEKEAKKNKVLAGKTRDKYKQIRKKRLS